ncbi:hypothetical protein [Terrabacter terrigena]|uniref:Uncharacterized protein n=1 Tax=Terrabacter terrigena TaxID=574718 RepID=A0ABW3MZ46_9MICO
MDEEDDVLALPDPVDEPLEEPFDEPPEDVLAPPEEPDELDELDDPDEPDEVGLVVSFVSPPVADVEAPEPLDGARESVL